MPGFCTQLGGVLVMKPLLANIRLAGGLLAGLLLSSVAFSSQEAKDDEVHALVVVDMQAEFPAARNAKTQQAVASAIKTAIALQNPIIFLEYVGYGRSLEPLRQLVEGYERAYFRKKATNDGSGAVHACLARFKIDWQGMQVCGVNTDACVFNTVTGLQKRNDKQRRLQVLAPACYSLFYHKEALGWMGRLAGVELVLEPRP